MGVQLNIKDERTVQLARDLARQLGKSVTDIIREALEEKANAREAQIAAKIARINAVVDDMRARMSAETRAMTSKQLMDSIYGPDGLPE